MNVNPEKMDEVILALLSLNMFSQSGETRAWKSFPWEAMDRLFQNGYISDPKSAAKSVWVSEDGRRRAVKLFNEQFVDVRDPPARSA